MRQKFPVPSKRKQPSGFTMVELLIAIGIIALLVAILATAIGPTLVNTRVNATKATLRQIDSVLKQRAEAIGQTDVSAEAKKIAALSGGTISIPQATFIIKKMMYRQAFPQRVEDLGGWDLSVGTPVDNSPLATVWGTFTNFPAAAGDCSDATSSALLYLALTQGNSVRPLPGGKAYPLPVLDPGSINSRHIVERNVRSAGQCMMPVFVDEWDTPYAFYNFPTDLISNSPVVAKQLVASLPADTNQDPLDPVGTLSTPFVSWSTIVYAPSTQTNARPFNSDNYHQLNRFYLPLVVSGGPDQATGLGAPHLTTSNSHLAHVANIDATYDNITNHQP